MAFTFFHLADPDAHVCRTHADVEEAQHRDFLDSLTPAEHQALLDEAIPLANALCQAIARHNQDSMPPLTYGGIIEALRLVRTRMALEMDALEEDDCDA